MLLTPREKEILRLVDRGMTNPFRNIGQNSSFLWSGVAWRSSVAGLIIGPSEQWVENDD